MRWRTCVHKNGCPPVEVEVLMAHWEIFSILSEVYLGSCSMVLHVRLSATTIACAFEMLTDTPWS